MTDLPCPASPPPPGPPAETLLEVAGLEQVFCNNAQATAFTVRVPECLRIPRGGFVSIRGPNGCGKTTLLTVLALLRRPSNLPSLDSFQLWLPDLATPEAAVASPPETIAYDLKQTWTSSRGSSRMGDIRRRHFGFCPQQLELLPGLTVEETIGLSLHFNSWPRHRIRERTEELLGEFDLTAKRRNRVDSISGGQQQKVTIARAIAHAPAVVFLDEPTAFLHIKTARQALLTLKDMQERTGRLTTIIMITHDNEIAEEFSTTIINMDGDGHSGWLGHVEHRPRQVAPEAGS